jgi:hypothetical protein
LIRKIAVQVGLKHAHVHRLCRDVLQAVESGT